MFNQGGGKKDFHTSNIRVPINFRIIGWYLIIVSAIQVFLALMLASGILRLGDNPERFVFFSLIFLDSRWHFVLYMFCLGSTGLFCGIGLLRTIKLAWWVTLILSLYYLYESILMLNIHYINWLFGCIEALIIICLLWKKQAYIKASQS